MQRKIILTSIVTLVVCGIGVGIFTFYIHPATSTYKMQINVIKPTTTPTPTTIWSFVPHPSDITPTVTAATPTASPTYPTIIPTTPTLPTPRPTHTVVVATPTPGNTGSGTAQLTQQLFQQINSDRADQNLPAYTWDDKIAAVSSTHSATMGKGCGLSHQCPGEPAPCQRLTNAGISWMACGENAGYTSPTPNQWSAVKTNVEQGMLNEQAPDDGHRRNLLSTSYHKVGIGIYIDAKGLVWVTEDFTN